MERVTFSFGRALEELRSGKKVAREEWDNQGHILLQKPEQGSKISRPYLYAVAPGLWSEPWFPAQVDLFTDDWYIVD